MKIATWNINSIRARLQNFSSWTAETAPDIVLLQETKCEASAFPALDVKLAGYPHQLVAGQKSYNGVAILSRHPIISRCENLYSDDLQARYIEGESAGLIVASLYVPNGNPIASEKLSYKRQWLQYLERRAESLFLSNRPVLLGGDFNIIPNPVDAARPAAWVNDALFIPEIRAAYARFLNRGWVDAWRGLHPDPARGYTFWDYKNNAFQRDEGIRIDHMLLSPEAADRLVSAEVDRAPRMAEKASDHTPLVVEIGQSQAFTFT